LQKNHLLERFDRGLVTLSGCFALSGRQAVLPELRAVYPALNKLFSGHPQKLASGKPTYAAGQYFWPSPCTATCVKPNWHLITERVLDLGRVLALARLDSA